MTVDTHEVVREETCSQSVVRRVSAMLDLDASSVLAGGTLPRGWQFVLLGADTRRSELRSDGFGGFGIRMPDLGLPRLLVGGRSVHYAHDVPIGANVRRVSRVASQSEKSTASGPMAVVTIAHEIWLSTSDAPAITEEQTYLLLGVSPGSPPPAGDSNEFEIPESSYVSVVVPDDTLLFQYSALGFNSHRIHLDRTYAREVEGFPDLVVNGGLSTLLLTEFLRRDIGVTPNRVDVRYSAPLFARRPITLTADERDDHYELRALDDTGRVAVGMKAFVR